ncbi:MAG: dephospho-CoA kinase [Oscillospiraceae bacterium]|nr:dephospho-CoA kinase [Oscillospiraceae bacterium]
MIVGLTGQSGAGKTCVSALFAEHGFYVINADEVSREVTRKGTPCLDEIAHHFGQHILLPDGNMDRKAVGNIVFSDRQKLKELEGIIFPYIIKNIMEKADSHPDRDILLDAPTLFEAGLENICTCTVAVTADREQRLRRIIERDGITAESALKRIYSQRDESFFRERCDHVIDNSTTKEELEMKTKAVIDKICSL